MADFYETLAVSRRASPAEIRSAYRRLVLRVHPDRAGADDPDAARRFREVQRAYEVLGDPRRRALYDRWLADDELAARTTARAASEPKEQRAGEQASHRPRTSSPPRDGTSPGGSASAHERAGSTTAGERPGSTNADERSRSTSAGAETREPRPGPTAAGTVARRDGLLFTLEWLGRWALKLIAFGFLAPGALALAALGLTAGVGFAVAAIGACVGGGPLGWLALLILLRPILTIAGVLCLLGAAALEWLSTRWRSWEIPEAAPSAPGAQPSLWWRSRLVILACLVLSPLGITLAAVAGHPSSPARAVTTSTSPSPENAAPLEAASEYRDALAAVLRRLNASLDPAGSPRSQMEAFQRAAAELEALNAPRDARVYHGALTGSLIRAAGCIRRQDTDCLQSALQRAEEWLRGLDRRGYVTGDLSPHA